MSNSSHGFTLLEMLMVLVIIGIVGAASVSISGRTTTSARLREASMQIADDISAVRTNAAIRGKSGSIVISANRTEYVILPENTGRILPLGVNITFAQDATGLARPGTTVLSFSPSGVNIGGTYTLTAGTFSRRVEIAWPSGVPRHLQ